MIRVFEHSLGEKDHRVHACVILCGEDIVVTVGGGSKPHVGAVSVAITSPKISEPSQITSTPSVVSIPGHKENQIVQMAALRLSRKFKTNVVVSAGVHIDNATPKDIQALVKNFHKLIDVIENKLASNF